jgi:lipopolysaccharide export system protein LptA
MKTPSSLLLCLLLPLAFAGAWPNLAAQTEPRPAASSADHLLIVCTNGGDFSAASAVFRGEVRVLEPQMYLECELLTLRFQTNSAGGLSRTASAGLTNLDARIETIVAETNVMMMARDTTILGDRAVYTASNEVVVVTGALVVIETDKSYTYGEHFVFNRKTGQGFAVGPTVVEIKSGGTNAFAPTFGTTRKTPATDRPPRSGSK